jgi:DNA-binding NtrC family response regulator
VPSACADSRDLRHRLYFAAGTSLAVTAGEAIVCRENDPKPVTSFARNDGTRLRVLVVEDETLIRWAVAEALTAAGHVVVEAPDAVTARRVVAESPEPLDAVLLDLRLPDSSDLSLLQAIRRESPSSAVVMMTAHGTADDAARARALGAFEVLEKPFDVQAIEPLVVAAWRARSEAS